MDDHGCNKLHNRYTIKIRIQNQNLLDTFLAMNENLFDNYNRPWSTYISYVYIFISSILRQIYCVYIRQNTCIIVFAFQSSNNKLRPHSPSSKNVDLVCVLVHIMKCSTHHEMHVMISLGSAVPGYGMIPNSLYNYLWFVAMDTMYILFVC